MTTHRVHMTYEVQVLDEDKAITEAQQHMTTELGLEPGDDEWPETIEQVLEIVFDLDQTGDAEDIPNVRIMNRIFSTETVV